MNEYMEALKAAMSSFAEEKEPVQLTEVQRQARKELLLELISRYNEKEEFKVGDVVVQKPGLATKKEDEVMVVYKVLNEPIFAGENDTGSPYFREPLDIIIATLGKDGTLLFYYMDSRRLQKASI